MSNIPFARLIQKVDTVRSARISDEAKLRLGSELIYEASEQILQRSKTLLRESQQSNIDEADTKIDSTFSSFLVSLTQQSISSSFLVKYLQPQFRADYKREGTSSIRSLSAIEALDELAEDLIEQGSPSRFPRHRQVLLGSEVLTLAHDENIEIWIESVERHLELYPDVNTLPKIAKSNNLTLAQVFIAALFGSFKIEQCGDFYEVKQLRLFK